MTVTESSIDNHTRHPIRVRQARKNTAISIVEPGAFLPDGGFLFIRHPNEAELGRIQALARLEIGPAIADLEVVKSVYAHNPISFWAFLRSADQSRVPAELVGFCAFLPLSTRGVDALRAGQLDAGDPDRDHLAPDRETPAALYIWAIVAHGTADLGGMLIGHALSLDLWERIPIFGTVGTESGRRAIETRQNSPQSMSARVGSFFEIRHPKKYIENLRALEVYALPRPPSREPRPQLEIRLASTPDEISKVFAIRAAVFMAEQTCPYEEEFDGNDYAGAHVIGFVNGEAAAVLRIRYFADFVKLERLAVLPEFRRTLIAKEVVEHAIAICRRKGYRKMYGHAQKRLVGLWRRFGFEPMHKNTPLIFSDHEYVEMLGDIAPHDAPLTPFSNPYMLIRPEGRWDVPGVLDYSAKRLASNPQRDRIRMEHPS